MVHRMQVVFQKQDRQRPAIFDDHTAATRLFMGLMLQKRADLEDSEAGIDSDCI